MEQPSKKSKVRKQDLKGHSLENDTSIVRIDEETGELYLVHVESYLDDGRHIVFNGEIRIPLKDFEWREPLK